MRSEGRGQQRIGVLRLITDVRSTLSVPLGRCSFRMAAAFRMRAMTKAGRQSVPAFIATKFLAFRDLAGTQWYRARFHRCTPVHGHDCHY
jgi:hypothetical protein